MSSTLRSTVSSRLSGWGSACSPLGALATASCDGNASPTRPTSTPSETTKRSQRAMLPPCHGNRPTAGLPPESRFCLARPRGARHPGFRRSPDVADLAVATPEEHPHRDQEQPAELGGADGDERDRDR